MSKHVALVRIPKVKCCHDCYYGCEDANGGAWCMLLGNATNDWSPLPACPNGGGEAQKEIKDLSDALSEYRAYHSWRNESQEGERNLVLAVEAILDYADWA